MTQDDSRPDDIRRAWDDYCARQDFEHRLIDRKTMWLLTTQGLFFAAYGVTIGDVSDPHLAQRFRDALPWIGIALNVLTFVGVLAVINSKRISWRDYREHFGDSPPPFVPGRAWVNNTWRFRAGRLVRRSDDGLQWGVRTLNTRFSLAPDAVLPIVFAAAWIFVLVRVGD